MTVVYIIAINCSVSFLCIILLLLEMIYSSSNHNTQVAIIGGWELMIQR